MILGDLFESRMSDLDIQYQDYKNLEPVAFHSRYKMTKDEWASKHWSLIKSSETVHEETDQLSVGDPVIIQGTEYDGKTGDVKEFSPSGKFVVVDLYNYGPQAFHLSNVEYNEYADDLDEEKRRLDPKCWKGKKIGNPKTKMKGGVRVNNCVPVEEEQLDELKFLGSECTKDCSGHRAGYNWSKKRGGVDGMSPWSPSFNKGAALAKAGK